MTEVPEKKVLQGHEITEFKSKVHINCLVSKHYNQDYCLQGKLGGKVACYKNIDVIEIKNQLLTYNKFFTSNTTKVMKFKNR